MISVFQIYKNSSENYYYYAGVVSKLYAHFINTEGLHVLVMELQGISLHSFIKGLTHTIHPNIVSDAAIEIVSSCSIN